MFFVRIEKTMKAVRKKCTYEEENVRFEEKIINVKYEEG